MKKALIVLVLVLFTAITIPAQTHLSGLSHVKTIGKASAVQLSIPSGFRQIDIGSGEGVRVFRKDYAGNRKDFVTIIDLRHASIRSLTGDVVNVPQGQVYRKALTEFWNDAVKLEASDQKARIVVNGTFFADRENGREINPTGISFGLKTNGKVISYGYGLNEYPGRIRAFAFNIPAHRSNVLTAWIQPHSEAIFNQGFTDLVGALDPDVNKQKAATIPRTFLGVRDNDSDGNYETVFIFSSNAATQNSAASILSSFGATEIVMLDGGGSTGLLINGTPYINTSRSLPHTLAVYVKNASPDDLSKDKDRSILEPPSVTRRRNGDYVLSLTQPQREAVDKFLLANPNLVFVTPAFDQERNSSDYRKEERDRLISEGLMQYQYACWGDLNRDGLLDVALVFASKQTVNDWGWREWWIVAYHGNALGRYTPAIIAKERAGAFDGLVYEQGKNLIIAALFGTHNIGSYRWNGKRYIDVTGLPIEYEPPPPKNRVSTSPTSRLSQLNITLTQNRREFKSWRVTIPPGSWFDTGISVGPDDMIATYPSNRNERHLRWQIRLNNQTFAVELDGKGFPTNSAKFSIRFHNPAERVFKVTPRFKDTLKLKSDMRTPIVLEVDAYYN